MRILISDSGGNQLPGHMLPKGARSFEVTVNLAVGKEKARCWRNEVYAEDRAHPLLPLGRLRRIWEKGEALMQCRDKGQWRTMTKFEIRNNLAYASQMQFEVLHRAVWAQQAQPQTIFDWKFWEEKAVRDPKITAYLNHGVKAKMCETTPFVNSVGSQYIAARAQVEMACDSLQSQAKVLSTSIGLSEGIVYQATESNQHIAKSLLKDVTDTWSTMVMRTMSRSAPGQSSKSSGPSIMQTSSSRMSPMASSTDNVGNRNSRTPTGCHC